MKKEYNEIDELFNQAFDEIQVEYDKELVWSNIQQKKKKRRVPLFILFGVLAMLVVSVFTWYSFRSSSQVASSSLDDRESTNINQSLTEEQLGKAQTDHRLREDATSNSMNPSIVKAAAENKNPPINTTSSDPEYAKNESTYATESMENIYSQNAESKKILTFSNFSSEGHVQKNEKSFLTTKNQLPLFSSFAAEDVIDTSNTAKRNDGLVNNLLFSKLSTKELTLLDIDFYNYNRSPEAKHMPLSTNTKPTKWKVSLLNSMYMPTTYYQDESITSTVLSNRTHKDLISYGNQLQLKYQMNKNLGLILGIERLQLYEKFHWRQVVAKVMFESSDKAYFILDNDEKIWIEDMVYVLSRELRERVSLQTLTQYNLPIGLQYQAKLGRLHIGADLSCVLQFAHHYRGFLFNDEFTDAFISRKKDYFKELISYSVELRPFVEYPINQTFSIGGGLKYRWSPDRRLYNDIVRKSQLFGMDLSLQYTF